MYTLSLEYWIFQRRTPFYPLSRIVPFKFNHVISFDFRFKVDGMGYLLGLWSLTAADSVFLARAS